MKIALASDLHLEFGDVELHNTDRVDVLVLAGDISVAELLKRFPETTEVNRTSSYREPLARQFREFIRRTADRFPYVIAVAGNHEFYEGYWHETLDILYEEYSKVPNIHFLEDRSVVIHDWKFIGGTMWTDLDNGNPIAAQAVARGMNDYRKIINETSYRRVQTADTVARNRRTVSYIKEQVKDFDKCVVVTHMAPCSMSVHEQYAGDILNYGYYSDQSNLILDNPSIRLWCHGHMHNESDYTLEHCRVVCNPRGYVGHERGTQEEEPYYPKIIEL